MGGIKQYRNYWILFLIQMIANVVHEVSHNETGPQCNKWSFPDKINIQHQCSLSESLDSMCQSYKCVE